MATVNEWLRANSSDLSDSTAVKFINIGVGGCAGQIGVVYLGYSAESGRHSYGWAIADCTGVIIGEGYDLRTGVGHGRDINGIVNSLLGFLGAAAEAVSYADRTGRASDNADLFPPAVMEWANANEDAIWAERLSWERI